MVFDFDDYRSYLKEHLDKPGSERGLRSKLATHLRCQTSFISHVLSERAHFSLEHALLISEFFGHSAEERHYFLLLVQSGKAGTEGLRAFFQAQIGKKQAERELIREKIAVNNQISAADQAIYYSMWWYLAVHMLVGLPETRTREGIAARLGLMPEIVQEALDFLTSRGFIIAVGNSYRIGQTRLHLGSRSPLMVRHHTNWRIRAIGSIEKMNSKNLHFSGIIGVSRKDAGRIRSLLLELLQKSESILKSSKEEAVYIFNMDFAEF